MESPEYQKLLEIRTSPESKYLPQKLNGNIISALCLKVLNSYPDLPKIRTLEVLETLAYAYCTVNKTIEATETLDRISVLIPDKLSIRKMIIEATIMKQAGLYKNAQEVLQRCLEIDECNMEAPPLISECMDLAGDIVGAIEFLVGYLSIHLQVSFSITKDTEAWLQLSGMYIRTFNLHKARFCVEEVLMMNPKDLLVVLKWAGLLDDEKRFEEAVKAYCLAIEIKHDCRLAWIGIQRCTKTLIDESEKEYLERRGVNTEKCSSAVDLYNLSSSQLRQLE